MEDLDDPYDDECVNFNLLRGLGEPTVGTDKIIESGQTFDRNNDLPQSRAEAQVVSGGVLEASPSVSPSVSDLRHPAGVCPAWVHAAL